MEIERFNSQTVFFDIHKQFLNPDHVVRQATEAEQKLQSLHNDGKEKGWD